MAHYPPIKQLVTPPNKMARSNLTAQSCWTCTKLFAQIDRLIFLTPGIFGYFFTRNPIKKTINCSNVIGRQVIHLGKQVGSIYVNRQVGGWIVRYYIQLGGWVGRQVVHLNRWVCLQVKGKYVIGNRHKMSHLIRKHWSF